MKLLKICKYKEEARTLIDLLEENNISYEERKIAPVEILVSEEDYEKSQSILKENETLIRVSAEKWFALTTAPDEITAEIIKSSLDSAGIPCVLKGLTVPYGEPIILGQGGIVPMEIIVPESFYDTAKKIIEESNDFEEQSEDKEGD